MMSSPARSMKDSDSALPSSVRLSTYKGVALLDVLYSE